MANGKRSSRPGSKTLAGGEATIMARLDELLVIAKRNEVGINMVSQRMDSVESDLNLMNQKVGGVMELGGSVLDVKEEMSKSLRKVQSKLHALTKAQVRTYDMIAAHTKEPAHAAHAVGKISRR